MSLHLGSCCLLDDSTHLGALGEVVPYLSKGLISQIQFSLQCRCFLLAHRFFCSHKHHIELQKRGEVGASQRKQGRGLGETSENGIIFSLLFLNYLLLCPSTYPKGCYFYYPQSPSVIKSMMVDTAIRT